MDQPALFGIGRQVMREADADRSVHAAVPERDVENRRRHPGARRGNPGRRAGEADLADCDVGLDDEVGGVGDGRRDASAAAGQFEDHARVADAVQVVADALPFLSRAEALVRIAPVDAAVGGSAFDRLVLGLVGIALARGLGCAPGVGRAVHGE